MNQNLRSLTLLVKLKVNQQKKKIKITQQKQIPNKQEDELATAQADAKLMRFPDSMNKVVPSTQRPRTMAIRQKVPKSNEGPKKDFCLFCLTLQPRLDRHLEKDHKDKKEVKVLKFMSKEGRKKQFKVLRTLGNDIFNNDATVNPENIILCPRREQVKNQKNLDTIDNNVLEGKNEKPALKLNKKSLLPPRMMCGTCYQYYSSKNLRNHKCPNATIDSNKGNSSNTRQTVTLSKEVMGICHKIASDAVRTYILPKLKLDEIGVIARYDYLIMLYANKFVLRYQEIDQQPYVRGHMRLLAKLKFAIMEINPKLDDLILVFRPIAWPLVLKAINKVAEHDASSNKYMIIYNAETLPMFLRKCIKILKHEFTIKEDRESLQLLDDFSNVFENDIEFNVSYLAQLSRKESTRHKTMSKLPTMDDVLKFENYLKKQRQLSLDHFENNGRELQHYLTIMQNTALLILIYNRRRVGEVSKTKLNDFTFAIRADPSSEFFQMLPLEEQKQRLKYMRIQIHGKKKDGEGCLFINHENERCLELTVKYRSMFGISEENQYLFALPSGPDKKHRHIKLCELVTKTSLKCSEEFKEIDDSSIRGTLLRKQLATFNSTINNDQTTNLISKHLGHSRQIHDTHYKRVTDFEQNQVTHTLDKINAQTHAAVENRNEDTDEDINDTNYDNTSSIPVQYNDPNYDNNSSISDDTESLQVLKKNSKGKDKKFTVKY